MSVLTADPREVRRQAQLTGLWAELEWRRCAADPQYFLATYVYIAVPPKVDPRGKVLFELWDYQADALKAFLSDRYVVVVKARQLGFTTLAMGLVLHDLLFSRGTNDLIVSRTQASATKNLGMVSAAYRFLPQWLKDRSPLLTRESDLRLEFTWPDGQKSYAKSAAATKGVFAGETATRVVSDEMALWDEPDAYRTLVPTTDAGGSLILISTARGPHNTFASLYRGAKRGENAYTAIFEPWWKSRFNTQATYDAKRREHIAEPWRFYAEYPSSDEEAFRESGESRFPVLPEIADEDPFPEIGHFVADQDTGEYRWTPDPDGPVRLVSLVPDPLGFYTLAADPSTGTGGDSHGAHLLYLADDGRPEIMGVIWSNTLSPTEFAVQLDALGRHFAGSQWAALLAVEQAGGYGELVINELQRHLLYPNPYVHLAVAKRRARRDPKAFAFPMTTATRKPVIDKLADYLAPRPELAGEARLIGMYPELREQLGQFVAQRTPSGGVKYMADAGCHDDLVMSLAEALWLLVEEAPTGTADAEESPSVRIGERDPFPTRTRARAEALEAAEAESSYWASMLPDARTL